VTKVLGYPGILWVTTERIDLATAVSKTALLSSLSSAELQAVAARTVPKLLSAGERMFSEGELCNGLHIIARRKVRIFKTSVNGREEILSVNVSESLLPSCPSLTAVPSQPQR
jgi:CRP/FNR family transcriptional regulator, dissimilatory nitrate respiration regulator